MVGQSQNALVIFEVLRCTIRDIIQPLHCEISALYILANDTLRCTNKFHIMCKIIDDYNYTMVYIFFNFQIDGEKCYMLFCLMRLHNFFVDEQSMIFDGIHMDNDSSILLCFVFDHLAVIRLLSCDVRTLNAHFPSSV